MPPGDPLGLTIHRLRPHLWSGWAWLPWVWHHQLSSYADGARPVGCPAASDKAACCLFSPSSKHYPRYSLNVASMWLKLGRLYMGLENRAAGEKALRKVRPRPEVAFSVPFSPLPHSPFSIPREAPGPPPALAAGGAGSADGGGVVEPLLVGVQALLSGEGSARMGGSAHTREATLPVPCPWAEATRYVTYIPGP